VRSVASCRALSIKVALTSISCTSPQSEQGILSVCDHVARRLWTLVSMLVGARRPVFGQVKNNRAITRSRENAGGSTIGLSVTRRLGDAVGDGTSVHAGAGVQVAQQGQGRRFLVRNRTFAAEKYRPHRTIIRACDSRPEA